MQNFASSFGGFAHGLFPTFLRAERPLPIIAAEDIGASAARALVDGGQGHRVLQLSGPEELSMIQVAAAFSETAKRPLRLEVGPDFQVAEVLVGYGMGADMARLYQELTIALNRGEITYHARLPVTRGEVSLHEVARRMLA